MLGNSTGCFHSSGTILKSLPFAILGKVQAYLSLSLKHTLQVPDVAAMREDKP